MSCEPPALSVIVLTHRTAADLRRCLTALAAAPCTAAWELLIVNNSPEDDIAVLRDFPALPARVLGTGRNRGVAGGKNLGAAAARGGLLLFLDVDTEVTPGALDALLDAARRHPTVGAFGPRLLNGDGSVQTGYYELPRLAHLLAERALPRRWWRDRRPPTTRRDLVVRYDREQPIEWISGCAFVVRRAVFARLGGFDPEFFCYYDEPEFCARARAAGVRMLALPTGTIVHHGGAVSGQSSRFGRLWAAAGTVNYFRRRGPWVGRAAASVLGLYLLAGALRGALAEAWAPGRTRTRAARAERRWRGCLWRFLRRGTGVLPTDPAALETS